MLAEYLQRVAAGEEFPGHFTNIIDNIDKTVDSYSGFTITNEMLLFSRKQLIEIFENNGLQLIKSYSLLIPPANEDNWREVPDAESNLVGLLQQNYESKHMTALLSKYPKSRK